MRCGLTRAGRRLGVRLGGVCGLALAAAAPCFAEEPSGTVGDEPDGPQPAPPASVAELQLSLPTRANLGSLGAEASRRWWPSYWEDTSVPNLWRGIGDSDLRLDVETARWELGALSMSMAYLVTPERERLCYPECSGHGASSAVRLKYDIGDLGPLQQFGPEMEIVTNAQDVDMAAREGDSPVPRNWILRIGLSWKF